MASFGEELRRERELRDISLKEISEATKISTRFLQALEEDDFAILPGGIFNRGFIRAYARFIGIDGEEMVNAYLHEVSLRQAQQTGPGNARGAPPGQEAMTQGESTGSVYRPGSPPRVRTRPHEPRRTRRAAMREFGRRLWNTWGATRNTTSPALWVTAGAVILVGISIIVFAALRARAGEEPLTAITQPGPSASPSPAVDPARATAPGEPASTEPRPGGTGDEATETAPRKSVRPAVPPSVKHPAGRETGAGARLQPARPAKPKRPSRSMPAAPAGPASEAIPAHTLRVVATENTRVRIECGGRVSLFQELWPGQTKTLRCVEPVVLGASNGGAIHYSLDKQAPVRLGRPGERIRGFRVAPAPTSSASDNSP